MLRVNERETGNENYCGSEWNGMEQSCYKMPAHVRFLHSTIGS